MRRVLSVSVVAIFVFVSLAFAQKETTPATGISGVVQAIVVAQGLPARNFAFGPQRSLYLTLASPQDRIFALAASSETAPLSSTAVAITPVAGTGIDGSLGDGGVATSAELSLSTSLLYERSGTAIANDGTIYIADTENATIRRIAGPESTEPGVIRSIAGRWAPRQNIILSAPMGIALDRAGNLYIADHGTGALDILHADTGLLETIAQIASAATVAVTADGTRAFVASPETGSVIAIDLHTRSMRAIAAISEQSNSGRGVSQPSPCPSSAGQPAQACPAGLAIDGAGNLFIADLSSGAIFKVDARTNAITTVLSNLAQPGALAFDETGKNLYIAEQGLNRIIEAQGMGDPASPLSLSPTSWTFPNEPLNGTSQQEQFTLTNNSGVAVSGIQITSPTASSAHGDFSLESTSCLSTLAANAVCFINVAFTPTSETDATLGTLTSSVSVTDSNGDSITPASISGTADDYQLELASSQSQEVSVVQGGSATFHLQVVALGAFGQNGEQVSILCPSDIPARSTCTVSPASLSPMADSSTPFTVTIQTSSPRVQSRFFPSIHFRWPGFGSSLSSLFTIIVFGGLCTAIFLVGAWRFPFVRLVGLTCIAVAILNGCHRKAPQATATPTGEAFIQVQGSALSKSGTPLNATRGATVILDVIQD